MAQGKRLHLSYERMVMLVDGCPAYKDKYSGGAQITGPVDPDIISRIQNISYSFNYNAIRNPELGSTEYIKHRTFANSISTSRIPILSQPTVSLNFDYLLYDGSNESKIGFNVGPEGFLNYSNFPVDKKNKLYSRPEWNGTNFDAVPDKGDANFYVLIDDTSSRADVLGDRGGINFDGMDVVGFGNCYLSDYSINIAVGSFVNCSVSYLCSNLAYDIIGAAEIKAPSVDGQGERSQVVVNIPENALENDFVEYPNDIGESLALRPGDIDVKIINNKPLSNGGFHLIDLNKDDTSIESINFSLPIERKDINGFGSNYINDRKIQFPIMANAEMTIITRNFEGQGSIKRIFDDDVDCDIEVEMFVRVLLDDQDPAPNPPGGKITDFFPEGRPVKKRKIKITAKNAKLNQEDHSHQVGGFSRINASFLFEVTPQGGFVFEVAQ